jgi:hypothetical protein
MAIWQAYLKGANQMALAAEYGLTQGRISQIISEVRASLPERDKSELVQESAEFMRWARAQALTLWEATGAPVTAGKDGDVVYDPETGAIVRDHAGRLAGLRTAVDVERHLAKLLGLDAATKLDANVTGDESAAMAALAAEAAQRVAGDE